MKQARSKVGNVRWLLVFSTAVTAGCVPTARLRPPAEVTLNAPPAPSPYRSAVGLLSQQPASTQVTKALAPQPGEQTVEGAYRWAGNEYRYIAPRNEKAEPSYVWKRP